MKIQCPCGSKYSFDVTPEMASSPIRFVCQNCGADSSALVNELIRQQLGLGAPVPSVAPEASVAPEVRPPSVMRVSTPAPAPSSATAGPIAPPTGNVSSLRVGSHAASAAAAAPETVAPQICPKHIGQLTTHQCVVCQKPICPQCMQLFGFVCSAYCKGKAENEGIDIPVFTGKREFVQSRGWRKVGLITLSVVSVLGLLLGAWAWYAWVGSVPKVAFAFRTAEPGFSGQVRVCAQEQVVFLHGGTLARHDMQAKKEVWSNVLIDKKGIGEEATKQFDELQAARVKFKLDGGDLNQMAYLTREQILESLERSAAEVLHLYVREESVWISSPGKLTRYDWQTGTPGLEIPLAEDFEEPMVRGDELLFVSRKPSGEQALTRINLSSGESRNEEFVPASAAAVKPSTTSRPAQAAAKRPGTNQLMAASEKAARPLDPAAIAARVENMSKPARLALPAVIAANANQQRLMAEMKDQPEPGGGALPSRAAFRAMEDEPARVFITSNGVVQLSARLLETKVVQRKAMRDAPKKSALDGPINQAATAAIANELLNDIARDRGGDVVEENISRYQVTLRRPGAKEVGEWVGEVTGSPGFIPLQTVDAVTGGKSVIILDKAMKKQWEAQFTFGIPSAPDRGRDAEAPSEGEGPCVERGDALYVYDDGVLTAFDLASGNVRWRLPSVGTTGLFFDEQGMIYVNTSSGTPDNLKYSNEIDVTDKIRPVVLKVEPKAGKTLWRANNDGVVSYISGKLVYTLESYHGDDDDADGVLGAGTIFHVPAHVRIKRLDAGNGRVLWHHYQQRFPLDVRYDKNSIHLLFKKEVQVLRFILL